MGAFPEQDVDDRLGGAAGTDDEGVPVADPQPERPQRDAESVHVRVVALGPAVPKDDRIHHSQSFRIAIEFVHGSSDRLLVRAGHIEASDSKAFGREEELIKGFGRDVERQIDGGQTQSGQGRLVHRRRNRVSHRMADQTEDHRLAAAEACGGPQGQLTWSGR